MQAGLYEDASGVCSTCPKGFYCSGDGLATPCQSNATTLITATSSTDCVCNPGYFYSVSGNVAVCRPCNRKSYKPNVGNGDCPLTCPANADSELASIALADCFCEPQFYAGVDATGQLARCIPCTFEGLGCRGGFENQTNGSTERVHALPIALCLFKESDMNQMRFSYSLRSTLPTLFLLGCCYFMLFHMSIPFTWSLRDRPGFYQTGLTSAVACDVLMPSGAPACMGGETCIAQRLGDDASKNCFGTFGALDVFSRPLKEVFVPTRKRLWRRPPGISFTHFHSCSSHFQSFSSHFH